MIINAKAYITGVHDPERPRRLVKLPWRIGLIRGSGVCSLRGRSTRSRGCKKSPKTGALSVGFQKWYVFVFSEWEIRSTWLLMDGWRCLRVWLLHGKFVNSTSFEQLGSCCPAVALQMGKNLQEPACPASSGGWKRAASTVCHCDVTHSWHLSAACCFFAKISTFIFF